MASTAAEEEVLWGDLPPPLLQLIYALNFASYGSDYDLLGLRDR